MDYLVANWGSFISLVGLLVALVGLAWAIRRAGQASAAAQAAERASIETRAALARSLNNSDLQKAIAMIERLKEAHGRREWEVALVLYYQLRTILRDIQVATPREYGSFVLGLREDISNITTIENTIRTDRPEVVSGSIEVLSSVQDRLGTLASVMRLNSETVDE